MSKVMVVKANSTTEAYGDIQVGDIPTGSIVIVENEQVIGIADTWPVAFSKKCCAFHTFSDESLSFAEKLATMNTWKDFDFTDSIAQVQIELEKYGW